MSWFKKWKPEIEREIGYQELYLIIQGFYPALTLNDMTDAVYRIPADPADVLAHFPDKDLPYIPNNRDCDKFFHGLKWGLAKIGWGNLLVMDYKILLPEGAHRLAGFLHKDKIILGNPQGGKIVDYPFGIVKRVLV